MDRWNWTNWLGLPLCAAAAVCGVQPASAQDFMPSAPVAQVDFTSGSAVPTLRDFERLSDRLEAAEARIQALSVSSATAADATNLDLSQPISPAPPKRIHADGNPHLPSSESRLAALEKSLDKDAGPHFPTVRITGFFHLDTATFNQDAANQAVLGDIQNGVGFRRARLQAVGSLAEFTNYSIEMDFATAGRPSFMDVWGEQTHLPIFGNVRIGHYRQPFSMDGLTSIRQIQFLERSLPFQAFVPFRRVGVMAYDKSTDGLTQWAYGIYRTGGFVGAPLGDSRFASDIGDNGGISFSTRASHLLHYDEPTNGRYLLHLGGGYNYSQLTGGLPTGNLYEARAIPEFFVGDPAGGGLTVAGTPFFLDTGRLLVNQFHMLGLEIAGQAGPLNFQGEYMCHFVDQIGNPSLFYDGAYFQTGYFLTGENRTYNKAVGVFDRVNPFTEFFSIGRHERVCGWGAWEVAARWSYLNLFDPGAAPLAGLAGPPLTPNPGRMHNLTLGLNWYWNSYSKIQFNYIHSFLDTAFNGSSNCDNLCARFQVEF